MANEPIFHDNRRIASPKGSRGEFLQVTLADASKDGCWQYEVSLSRYCVPGRIDTYRFHYSPFSDSPNLAYLSEANTPLAEAVDQVRKDIELPQVRKMLIDMCGIRKTSSLCENVIASLAPKSKTLKAMRRKIKAVKLANRKAQ